MEKLISMNFTNRINVITHLLSTSASFLSCNWAQALNAIKSLREQLNFQSVNDPVTGVNVKFVNTPYIHPFTLPVLSRDFRFYRHLLKTSSWSNKQSVHHIYCNVTNFISELGVSRYCINNYTMSDDILVYCFTI